MISPQEINRLGSNHKEISTESDTIENKKKYVKMTPEVKQAFLDLIIH